MGSNFKLFIACLLILTTVLVVSWLGKANQTWIKKLLDWFPAILFAYVLPAGFTHAFGIDLSEVLLHDWSKTWIIPFAILTVMSALPIKQLKIVGLKPLIVFFSGSLIIAILPVLLVLIYGIGGR